MSTTSHRRREPDEQPVLRVGPGPDWLGHIPVGYGCPDWCTREDHEGDEVNRLNPPLHYGPVFGDDHIRVELEGRGWTEEGEVAPEVVISVDDNTGKRVKSAHDAILLAAHLTWAAVWLEGHHR